MLNNSVQSFYDNVGPFFKGLEDIRDKATN